MSASRHMNESCHTHRCVMSHIWMSHVTHMIESCHRCEWVMSSIRLVLQDVARCIRARDVINSCVWTLGDVIHTWHDSLICDMTYTCAMKSTGAAWCTGWRRPIECLKLQVLFRERATNYRALLRKMTYADKASYGSSPLCSTRIHRATSSRDSFARVNSRCCPSYVT